MRDLKIGVALGGGGMCGIAHIGFLQVLQENGIKIDMISGISMGAVIGGLYASGRSLEELEEFVLKLKKNEIIELNVFKILKESLLNIKKIEKVLKKLIVNEKIEDAKIEFYAQAADILTGKLYTYKEGSMLEAIRASSAIPGIFPPIYKNDYCLVDGGIVTNVPFKVLKEQGADVIIAVNCLNSYNLEKIPKNSVEKLVSTFDCVQYYVWELEKKLYKKNYDIYCFDNTPGIKPFSTDMKDISKLLESGRKSGEKYVNQIKKIIEKKEKLLKNT